MNEHAVSRFRTEIRHFYLVSLLNIVFAAVVMAFGVQYIVAAIAGPAPDPAAAGFRMLGGAAALVCMGLGLGWLLASVRVFRGVRGIRERLGAKSKDVTDERITCLIVRMLTHYRDNRRTIGTMILVCTLGGCCFFALGIAESLSLLSVSPGGIAVTISNLLVIPAMILTLGIAVSSLLSSYYFLKFANVWDSRLHEIRKSECALDRELGLDGA